MLKGGVVHETLSIRPPVAMLPVRRGVSRSPHAGHEAPFINESHIRIPLGKCPGKPLWQGHLIHPKIKEKHQPLYQKPVLNMVPKAGLEPARYRYQRILSPSRLPFHHFGKYGEYVTTFCEKKQGTAFSFFRKDHLGE